MDDEVLVGQIRRGNREAFRLLVLRYQHPLFPFLGMPGFDGPPARSSLESCRTRSSVELRRSVRVTQLPTGHPLHGDQRPRVELCPRHTCTRCFGN